MGAQGPGDCRTGQGPAATQDRIDCNNPVQSESTKNPVEKPGFLFFVLYRISEVYSDWYFFKIPLSPFVKVETGRDLEWVQNDSCDEKGCRSACFAPFFKKGGFWTGPYYFQPEYIYDNSCKRSWPFRPPRCIKMMRRSPDERLRTAADCLSRLRGLRPDPMSMPHGSHKIGDKPEPLV